MSKKLIGFLLLLILICTGCTFEKDDLVVSDEKIVFKDDVYTVDYFEGVVLSDLQIVDSRLSFNIRNEGGNDYITGLDRYLEYEVDGEWYQIKKLEMIDGVYIETPAIACCIPSGSIYEKGCDLYYFGATKWKDGRYRITVPFSYDAYNLDNYDNTWMQIPFTVSDGVPAFE